jgi:two-component system, chemotaxis family, protein-glutamate methylesterase/glutaminase
VTGEAFGEPSRAFGEPRGSDAKAPCMTMSRAAPRSEVIGICASTGGPQVLASVLGALPGGYSIPILVVQHMTPGFLAGLVTWLDREVALTVRLASDGRQLTPGVWFAPDGAHLTLDRTRRLTLDADMTAGNHRPSGDVLLCSLARVAGAGAVAVVLTGMGRDGAEGLAAVAAAGGRTMAQDERSSVVYGMPRVAVERGAQRVLAPRAIGEELAAMDQAARRA